MLDYGTIVGKGKGNEKISNIIKELVEIINKYNIDVITIEEYFYIKGKEKGMFIIPALLGVIKYVWYNISNADTIMIKARKWKKYVCGYSKASKMDIKLSIPKFINKDTMLNIERDYAEVRGQHVGDYGEQDCYDAIGQNLYICAYIENNRINKETDIFTEGK